MAGLIGTANVFALSAQANELHVDIISDGLEHPWAVAFLSPQKILVTERPGRLRLIENGTLHPQAIQGLPEIAAVGQGGLLDVVPHPSYAQNGWIYFSYSAPGSGGQGTAVARAKLNDMRLDDLEILFSMPYKTDSGHHFGSRIAFDQSDYLYFSIGDRGDQDRAQSLSDHAGSIIRLHDDGRIPDDNPFVDHSSHKGEIYSYGHRNPQGMAINPHTGDLWIHEHGPKGGDEINHIQAGKNYGWPVITYGRTYVLGAKIGEGTHKKGMAQPLLQWTPSIAPSGMMFYQGDAFPQWQGQLFVGALKYQMLVRLTVEGNKLIEQERMLEREYGRIRDVRNGPDGYIYLLIDDSNGKLLRLRPAQ